ncbi:MAG: sigma-70 family RNA polymerase sigma factor [Sedimentibacter sp.]|nr:sigma-70 family RNA polymerase sigma factor [Sedimentibacter sp.]
MIDSILVNLLKSNPSKGLEIAVQQYSGLVKTIVVRIIGYDKQQDVEETVSDVFVELWKSINNFDPEKGKLKNYIMSIARFVSLNVYNRRILKHELLPLEEDELEFNMDLDNEVSKSINKEIIRDTVNNLPYPDKDIFIRRYYLFESVKEIAQYLNLTPKSVENKLYRGKDKLKAELINKGIII